MKSARSVVVSRIMLLGVSWLTLELEAIYCFCCCIVIGLRRHVKRHARTLVGLSAVVIVVVR